MLTLSPVKGGSPATQGCDRVFFRKQKTAVNDNRVEPEGEAPASASVIAAGTTVEGNLESTGDLVVNGRVRGSVRAQRLTVDLDGLIEGDISADEVVVRGTVKGPVSARHIHLEAGSAVEGDLATATIAIDTGARLTGAVWQDQAGGTAETDATPAAGPKFTSASWQAAADDAFRPLAAVRPRLTSLTR